MAAAAYFFGGVDGLFLAFVTLIIIDYITGILKAMYNKNVSSNEMYKGGIKKIGMFFIVAVANIIDNSMELGGTLRGFTIGYYIANEGLSILENWGALGLPLPEKLRGILKQLREKN